jgi:hypothetical protein
VCAETEYFEDRLMEDRAREKQRAAAAALAAAAHADAATSAAGASASPSAVEMSNIALLAVPNKDDLYLGEEEMRRKAALDAKVRLQKQLEQLEADTAKNVATLAAMKGITAVADGPAGAVASAVALGQAAAKQGSAGAAAADPKQAAAAAAIDDEDPAILAARAAELSNDIAHVTANDSDEENAEAAHPSTRAKVAAALALRRLRNVDGAAAEALKYRKEPEEDESVYQSEVKQSQAEWQKTKQAACIIS